MQTLGKSIFPWKFSVVVELHYYLQQRFLAFQKLMRLSLCGEQKMFVVFKDNRTLNNIEEFVYLEGVHLG